MTSCKEAIKDLEVDGKVAAEMEEVRLCPIANMKPLIPKMDSSLSALKKCKQLRLVRACPHSRTPRNPPPLLPLSPPAAVRLVCPVVHAAGRYLS